MEVNNIGYEGLKDTTKLNKKLRGLVTDYKLPMVSKPFKKSNATAGGSSENKTHGEKILSANSVRDLRHSNYLPQARHSQSNYDPEDFPYVPSNHEQYRKFNNTQIYNSEIKRPKSFEPIKMGHRNSQSNIL